MSLELIDNLEYVTDNSDGISFVREIITVSPNYFEDKENNLSGKTLFVPNPNSYLDNERFTKLYTKNVYSYALSSALLKKCKDAMVEVLGGEKEKKEEDPDEKIKNKKIKEVLDNWKEENKDNEKFITKQYSIQTPIGYYAGKQGNEIANYANLNKLKYDELFIICNICEQIKGNSSSAIRKEGDSNWLKERTSFTPEGWRQRELLKNQTKLDLGYISKEEYDKKNEWAESFDFHPGWNFEETDLLSIEELKATMSNRMIKAVDDFNKAFCANAVYKMNIFLRSTDNNY